MKGSSFHISDNQSSLRIISRLISEYKLVSKTFKDLFIYEYILEGLFYIKLYYYKEEKMGYLLNKLGKLPYEGIKIELDNI